MGWIYNGTEFVKANPSQRKAYEKYNNQLLAEATLSEPFTVPAIALAGAAAAGVVTVASLGAIFWGPFKAAVDEGIEAVGDLPGELKALVVQTLDDAGVSGAEEDKFGKDLVACLKKHNEPLRGTKVVFCMTRKGWATDMVVEALTDLVGI
jgi:hypothetical protein